MRNELRIVFMGTPGFAVGVLQKLVEEGLTIVGVITAPDRPAGRGRKLTPSAVKEYAVEKGVPVLQPVNLKDPSFLEDLRALQANVQIVVAFRMLPKVVWQMPTYGTFNLHASLLPQYRGAAPINWAIINNEKTTGVTTFFIDDKIDTGEIILQKEVPVAPTETAGSLHDKLMETGSDLVLETVHLLQAGPVETQAQPLTAAHLKEAPKLTPENTRIDWQWLPEKIESFIKGLSPYPVAWTMLEEEGTSAKAKIFAAGFVPETHHFTLGSIHPTKEELKVAVTGGFLSIKEMQLPGKRKMDIKSLLNGYTFTEDAKFV